MTFELNLGHSTYEPGTLFRTFIAPKLPEDITIYFVDVTDNLVKIGSDKGRYTFTHDGQLWGVEVASGK